MILSSTFSSQLLPICRRLSMILKITKMWRLNWWVPENVNPTLIRGHVQHLCSWCRFLSSRHLVWRSLRFLMMLNSLDLRSLPSVKWSRAYKTKQQKGQRRMALHSCIVVNSTTAKERRSRRKKPERRRKRRRRRRGDVELAGVWHYCRMHEEHVEKSLSSSQESHLKHLQCAYTVNGRRDAINSINSLFLFSPLSSLYISTIQTISLQYWKWLPFFPPLFFLFLPLFFFFLKSTVPQN